MSQRVTSQWKREMGYFLPGTLLYFLVLAVLLAVAAPVKDWTGFNVLVLAWIGAAVLRGINKHQERTLLENATVRLDTGMVSVGQAFTCTFGLSPNRRFTLEAWSANLLGIKSSKGEYELEGDRFCDLTSVQRPYLVLKPNQPARFSTTLVVPPDAPPTRETDIEEVRWSVDVSVKLLLSPVWAMKEPIPLRVVSGNMQNQ